MRRAIRADEETCHACGMVTKLLEMDELTCGHLLCRACSPGTNCICDKCVEAEESETAP